MRSWSGMESGGAAGRAESLAREFRRDFTGNGRDFGFIHSFRQLSGDLQMFCRDLMGARSNLLADLYLVYHEAVFRHN